MGYIHREQTRMIVLTLDVFEEKRFGKIRLML